MSDAEAAQYDERAEAFIDRLARVMCGLPTPSSSRHQHHTRSTLKSTSQLLEMR
ncbi:MAG: hypothetical protein KIT87_01515 [Anaerolineae bacterium]|nr:hypothetical protein [Anaerolineae bacterium]